MSDAPGPEGSDGAGALRVPDGRLSGLDVLRRARTDRKAARAQLRGVSPEALASACQDLRPEARNEFLMLVDHPEHVVPHLPDAELCFTIRAGGMSEAAWLLEMATPRQRQACVDLDVWQGAELTHERALEWVDALIEAGREVLVRGIEQLDPEFWILSLKRMADVVVIGREDERPEGFFTEDGVVYFRAHADEDFARVKEIMQTAFSESQPYYWNMVHGMLFELPTECEEYALRWRTGRLADLGFPERDWAMRVYRPLELDQVETVDVTRAHEGEVHALVARSDLPRQLRGSLVGEALTRLPGDRAGDVLGYILGVANCLAVADGLSLSDAESIPHALDKAVSGIDQGLREVCRARDQAPEVVIETTRPLDLFRVGLTSRGTAAGERDVSSAGARRDG